MSISPPTADRIFAEALLRAAGPERAAYLQEICGDHPQLQERVERLLRAHNDALSFLETPPSAILREASPTIDQSSLEMPGMQIGPYKLLQQIGEGGMGVVYMAEQHEPVKRRVALKIIKPGMDTRQVIARFEAERQALSLMDHPNIAKVLDAGTTDSGRPYFVMELVKGQPITQYCDEKHLTPRLRLELLLPVCQAIQHAHQKGIIHRDIKPTNILVAEYDQHPVPKVIDFGVAKATSQTLTEKTMFTGLGQIVGTLEYMSPEQAKVNQLDIDTRSDIYSLGVLIYELLTGSTPLDPRRLRSAAFDEMLRIIREEEPQRPSTKLSSSETSPMVAANRSMEPSRLSRTVRGELDWIVMKALEKDRNRRYETAGALAADLQNYLNDAPVMACPPSTAYRLRKFARRNKRGLSVAALVLFFLVLLGSAVGWAWRDRSAREAEAARKKADRQTKVTGQIDLVRGEVELLLQEQKWPEALSGARRAEAIAISGEADAAIMERIRALLKDLEFINRLDQIRQERATPVGGGFDFAESDREYARAFHQYGVDVLELPVEISIDRLKARSTVAIPLAAALDDWIHCRRVALLKEPADWKKLVAVTRGIDPERLRDQVRATWGEPVAEVQDKLRRLADSIDIRAQHPTTLVIMVWTLEGAKNSDASLRILRDAQSMHPGDFWLNYELAYALERQRDHEGAIRYFTAAVAIRPNASQAHYAVGVNLAQQNRLDEGIACMVRANKISPRYFFPMGKLLERHQRPDEAIAIYRQGLEQRPKDVGLHLQLATTLRKRNRFEEAAASVRQAIHVNPQNRHKESEYYYYLAMLALQRANNAEYRKVCSGMLDTFKDADDAYIVACTCALGPDAVADWTKPLEVAESANALMESKYESITLLGALLYRAGRFKEASERLTEAESAHTPSALGARAYNGLFQAMANHQLGEAKEAAKWLEKAVPGIDEGVRDIDRWSAASTCVAWNDVLFQLLRRETEELLRTQKL